MEEDKENPKKEADLSRLVGDRSNKQQNLHMRLVLGSCEVGRSSHPSTGILKVDRKSLTGFSHIDIPPRCSQQHLCPWNTGNMGWDRRRGEEPLIAWVPGRVERTSSKTLWPTHNIGDAYFIAFPAFVTTNYMISSWGVYGRQADYNIKWIFSFSVGWQFSAWSAALKIMLLGTVVFIGWCWNDNALKIRSDVMSEWNAYLQSPSAY